MLLSDLITEDSSWPLWASLIKKSLEKGKPMYFASGDNRIVDIKPTRSFGKTMFVLYLEHTTRKQHGKPKKQTYTIWEQTYTIWTLDKFKDGHRLKMKNDPEDSTKMFESVEKPLVVSMFRKLKAEGRRVYYVTRGGKHTELGRLSSGLSSTGEPAWWFYPLKGNTHNAVVWKVGDNINRLTLTKVAAKSDPSLTYWALHDKSVKLNEEAESTNEPMLVRLIRQILKKKGVVKVDVSVLPIPKRLVGWVTDEPEHSRVDFSRDMWMLKVRKKRGGVGVLWLYDSADRDYILRKKTDDNGNPYVEMVEREAA